MKKAILILLVLATAVINNASAQSEDHYAIWQMDSTNEVNFTTYDLAAMEVRGHVKSIINGKSVCRYDKEGRMLAYADECSDFTLGRNADGCLTMYAVGAGSSTYSIDPETDQLVCYNGGEGATSWINFYKYDAKGRLTEIEYIFDDDAEGTRDTYTKSVTVLESDAHNNWTKRRIGNNIESRTITYYPNAICDEEETTIPTVQEFNPAREGYSFIGTIGGDKDAVLTIAGGNGYYRISYGQRSIIVDSYNKGTGKLVIKAYMKKGGPSIGMFDGTYKNGTYSGVFKNVKGGKVNFNLKMTR